MRRIVSCLMALALSGAGSSRGDEPVFSGPQVGEKLSPFTMRGVYDEAAGKAIDLVAQGGGKPILLVFVHDANRPSIALTRVLMTYAARRAKDGLAAGVVWLADDATAAEQFLRRARHALPTDVPIGISTDGKEGPGAYGLNRAVTLTVLVAKSDTVTGNFALVQPSVQADAPKILAEVVKIIGGQVPSLNELDPAPVMPEGDPKLIELLRPVIRRNAEPAEVERAASAVESYVSEHEAARKQLGQITRRIIDAGALDNYGTPKAREYLRAWAKRFGGEAKTKDANPGRSTQDGQPK